jgi:inhibitor of cysteine peptidase
MNPIAIKIYYNSHQRNKAFSFCVYKTTSDKRKGRARMFTKFILTIITMVVLVSLAGCGAKTPAPATSNVSDNSSQSGSSNTPTESNSADNYQMLPLISGKVTTVSLDAMADGTSQQLKKGEVMSISLESNPSTGYSWIATISDPAVLVQMGEPQYQEPAGSSTTPIVGAAGTDTFYFQAAETGTTTLTLDYKRAFETNVAPEKTIILTVEVK